MTAEPQRSPSGALSGWYLTGHGGAIFVDAETKSAAVYDAHGERVGTLEQPTEEDLAAGLAWARKHGFAPSENEHSSAVPGE